MEWSQSLNGKWDLWYGVDTGCEIKSKAEALEKDYKQVSAQVPGNVELDLIKAGICKDPFFGDNVLGFEKYEHYAWLFEREFIPESEYKDREVTLVLKGINTFADIFINGEKAAKTDNMLITHEIDITEYIKWGQENRIAIFISSSMKKARNMDFPVALLGTGGSDEITRLRMPPHSFGWDIMPRLLSAGIWRDVEIKYSTKEKFTEIYLSTIKESNKKAELRLAYRFKSDAVSLPEYEVLIEGRCGDSSFSKTMKTHFISNSLKIEVDDAKLWWPRGYGKAELYDVAVKLIRDGKLCDERKFRFGIRTAAIDASFDEKQKFCVMVNGEKIFIHGSNWVPLSALHSQDEERLSQAMELATGCGCNLLRCWGGNVYESDAFYDMCDELGILVWQDFAMACTIQPQDSGFEQIIYDEASSVIRRLRNHPSILLWAGDNEVDIIYVRRYTQTHSIYNRITREVLPRACAAHDPMRYYLPSSPYLKEGSEETNIPEQHLWGPRDDFKSDFYRLNTANFASEIGYHGCPAVSSLKKFISQDELWPRNNSRQWLVHNSDNPRYIRGYDRNELMEKQVAIRFGDMPEKLEDFAFASQISQAEAKKFFIEQFRMKKWDKTGIIWWNVLDGWPQISDAVVDFYFSKKLAYYFIARSQYQVQLMMDEYRAWGHDVWCVNDTLEPKTAECEIYDGETKEVFLKETVEIPRNGRAKAGNIKANPSQKRLYILAWTVDGETYCSHYTAGQVPFCIEKYREWIKIISELPPEFSAQDCWM
jgi:beta-mannosidase